MLLSPVTAAFRRLARLRGARAFHPDGRVGQGHLVLSSTGSALARALGLGQHAVTVRLSRGVGLPEASPDALGLAVRVEIADNPVDLLFTTTSSARWAPWLVLPARTWTARPYSTVLPYATGDDLLLVTLAPESDWIADPSLAALDAVSRDRPLTFDVRESHHGTVGRLVIEEVGADRTIAFDPMLHTRPTLRPARPVAALREAAYRGSRRGRTT